MQRINVVQQALASLTSILTLTVAIVLAPSAIAEKIYGPGVSDTEIKIGQTMPYSGPNTAAAMVGKAETAYFNMINERGGVNGRRIKLLSLDDGYNPAKTVEQTRKLVEQENVLAIFGSLGTAANTVIHKYLNQNKIPQLLITTIGLKWNDPENFPWTLALSPSPRVEVEAFIAYLLKVAPDAKIAILYQNDDFGKDYLKATRETLGAKAATMIVAAASYDATDPSIDSQIISLKASGADTLMTFTTPKFGAFAIRKPYEMGWRPLQFVATPSTSVATVLTPAGLEKSTGLISAQFMKDPTDSGSKSDSDVTAYMAWMKKYHPVGDVGDNLNVFGYVSAQLLVEILQRCGDDLTRENLLRQSTHLASIELPMLLPGISISTSPTDYRTIKQARLRRFDGARWVKIDNE